MASSAPERVSSLSPAHPLTRSPVHHHEGAHMHTEDLRQVHDVYDHVYLSPHLDDAALSCGGAIARHSSAGARVLVVTICTALPSPEGPFSSFAEEQHRQW